MSITTPHELQGMQRVSEAVGETLRRMRAHIRPGMSAQELDEYGGELLRSMGAHPAPRLAYDFPGWTCICVGQEVAHGIPTATKIFREGDLVNIDVSAEMDGYWSDNGGSFVLGQDIHGHQRLVDTSRSILLKALGRIRGGVKIAEIGRLIETEARRAGYTVIRNLTGHGVGRSLHEDPEEIANYYDRLNTRRFRKHSTVAVETFISTASTYAEDSGDGWTLVGNRGGFVAQHEHTILVTDAAPVILTSSNGI
ncbi:MAG: type I methionyl aminopeptidase [Bacteroidia bacterium]